jgi:quercetin dioxygenase-like cupin family protein
MRFTLKDEVFDWAPGTVIEIPPETVHRMEALEDSVILEVSTPELDDVVRLEDRYGRAAD